MSYRVRAAVAERHRHPDRRRCPPCCVLWACPRRQLRRTCQAGIRVRGPQLCSDRAIRRTLGDRSCHPGRNGSGCGRWWPSDICRFGCRHAFGNGLPRRRIADLVLLPFRGVGDCRGGGGTVGCSREIRYRSRAGGGAFFRARRRNLSGSPRLARVFRRPGSWSPACSGTGRPRAGRLSFKACDAASWAVRSTHPI